MNQGVSLHNLRPNFGATKSKKRLGRGHGSGLHKTSGKGTKGQKARTGHHGIPKPGFEGGQTPLARRVPKRGFKNPFRREYSIVNLGDISDKFSQEQSVVTIEDMKKVGLLDSSAAYVKVLSLFRQEQSLTKGLLVHAHRFSKSAEEKIKQSGGSIELVS